MENISETRIDLASGIVRIIVNDVMVPDEKFKWNDPEEYGGWLTLGEILEQLKGMDFSGGVIYVWEDTPLRGTIYQCGNYEPDTWYEYGKTKGFA